MTGAFEQQRQDDVSHDRQGPDFEAAIADLLSELSAVQQEMLTLLADKRESLRNADLDALAAVEQQEVSLLERLSACQQRRTDLLEAAKEQGLPGGNIRELAAALPGDEARMDTRHEMKEVSARFRLLQHQSIANWVVVQRSLIHLSQMLEILATGGRQKPTYDKGAKSYQSSSGGSLLDQAV